MAEKFVIVVTPPDSNNSSLTVEDAMQQVLEALQLLVSSSETDESFTWQLVEAKTNSPPFSVVGEARSTRPGIDVDLMARNQKKALVNNYNELLRGVIPEPWKSGSIRKTLESFIARNRNGVAKTEIKLGDDQSLVLTKQEAVKAFAAFEKPIMEAVKPYTQLGSIEGTIMQVGSFHRSPAVLIKERISGKDIWCLVDEEYRQQIAEEADFDDVWSGRRVRVRGKLEHDQTGNLHKVYASDVIPIDARKVSLSEIKDKNFTGGLNPSEYIDKFRDGVID